MKKISIIIPIYNEQKTLQKILQKVEDVKLDNLEKEIILVDDYSTDGTRNILKELENKYKVFYHDKNQGKGSALRTGFKHATGDFVIIQDADLECDPRNYPTLIKPILEGKSDVVFGSRFKEKKFSHFSYWFYLGNKFLTRLSNFLTGLNLTDIWTGYKVFKKEVIQEILPHLTAKRFEIEPELIALVSKKKYRICEIGLSFLGRPRTSKEGKKLSWKDGVKSLWYIAKFNLFK